MLKNLVKEKILEIGGIPYRVKATLGNYVKPEKWEFGRFLISSDWEKADFRLESSKVGLTLKGLAVNIYITGNKIRYTRKYGNTVSVLIEFVGDGEPSTYSKGILECRIYDGSLEQV